MNSIAADRLTAMFAAPVSALKHSDSISVESAILRYAQVKPQTTSGPNEAADTLFTGPIAHKDYRAIAQGLLARLDAMRDRAIQWRDSANSSFTTVSGGQSAPVDAGDWWRAYCGSSEPAHADSAGESATAPSATSPASSVPPIAASPTVANGSSVDSAAFNGEPGYVEGHGFILNDRRGVALDGRSVSGGDYGVVVDNGQTSEDVSIDGFSALGVRRYGMYLGSVRNWSLNDLTLQQGDGASEHGLRIADGQRITLSGSSIDTTRGHKSSMWLINVDDMLVSNTTFSGGAIRLGARPNDNQGTPTASNIVIRDSVINKVTGGDAEAIQVWPGSDHIHFANLDITLETSDNWLSIDSRNVANITWENIRVNGRLVTGFEGVKLGGMTPEEAAARGIGAASA